MAVAIVRGTTFVQDEQDGVWTPRGINLDQANQALRDLAEALGYKNNSTYLDALHHDPDEVKDLLAAL